MVLINFILLVEIIPEFSDFQRKRIKIPKIMKKIVVKVGTNVLSRDDGSLDITTISHLVDQISSLKKQGIQIILVSSGAVGSGRSALKHISETNPVIRRQLFASVGQVKLMQRYSELFSQFGIFCGQVLATREDFRDRTHYLNMKNCLTALLRDEIIPIVNENDVISVSELMFTDNDELAGLIAGMVDAEMLVLLTNVDGIFTGSPDDPESKRIPEIRVSEKKSISVLPIKSSFGRGGMQTKYRIALKSARMGIRVVIANGKTTHILQDILDLKPVGTVIMPETPVSGIKKWISTHNGTYKATITISEGAVSALNDRQTVKSLLPVGLIKIEGEFDKGDVLRIVGPSGEQIGVGIAQYSSEKAHELLGQSGKKALIHYDYLVLEP